MKIIYFTYRELKTNWHSAWSRRLFKTQTIATLVFMLFLIAVLSYFFTYIETREGYNLHDVVLKHIPAFDLSYFIFLIIYSSAVVGIINLLPKPILFLKAVQTYLIILVLRLVTIYFIPLEAPESIIPLRDPFVEKFFYGEECITKDLFFSGHVATVCLLYMANPYRTLKKVFAIVVMVVAISILVQHAHYSVDIIAAPFFAWISYKAVHSIK